MPKATSVRRSTRAATKGLHTSKTTTTDPLAGRPSWRERKAMQTTSQAKLPAANRKPATLQHVQQRRKAKKAPPAFAFLSRSAEQMQNDPNRRLPLFTLPTELVLHITSYLDLPSEICFTLTCKEAALTVGTESWKAFKRTSHWAGSLQLAEHRAILFELLLKNWKNGEEYCEVCGVIHPLMKPPRTHRKTEWTMTCLGQDAMIDYLPSGEGGGYIPVFMHIMEAMKVSEGSAKKGEDGEAPKIEMLDGDFTVKKPIQGLTWRLQSSGRRVDGRLVLKHVHTFQVMDRKALTVKDICSLPVRLCPHQSTTNLLPRRSMYIKSNSPNGPLLTHAIKSAFPTPLRKDVDMSVLRAPTKLEGEQMAAIDAGEDVMCKCRSCPTKYSVAYERNGTLVVTSWHSFGRDLVQASRAWKNFVRRNGALLGTDKRNDEWWSKGGSGSDFRCE